MIPNNYSDIISKSDEHGIVRPSQQEPNSIYISGVIHITFLFIKWAKFMLAHSMNTSWHSPLNDAFLHNME